MDRAQHWAGTRWETQPWPATGQGLSVSLVLLLCFASINPVKQQEQWAAASAATLSARESQRDWRQWECLLSLQLSPALAQGGARESRDWRGCAWRVQPWLIWATQNISILQESASHSRVSNFKTRRGKCQGRVMWLRSQSRSNRGSCPGPPLTGGEVPS